MPYVEIDTSACETRDGYAVSGYGTIVKVDGRELTEVKDIAVHIGLEEPVTVTTEVLVTDKFNLATKANLHIALVLVPGYELIEKTKADGTRSYTAKEVRHPRPHWWQRVIEAIR